MKKIEIEEELIICDDCLNEYPPKKIIKCKCGKNLCDFCKEVHDCFVEFLEEH